MGEISWDEKIIHQITEQITTIRILEKPEMFSIHWVKKNGRFHKHDCRDDGCDLCKKGVKKTPRYYIEVYDLGERIVKKLEMGALVYNQIVEFAKSHGNPIYYDITIERRMQLSGTRYDVFPSPTAPLSVEDQNIVDEAYGREIPIKRLILEGEVCPYCKVNGILDYPDFKCICPICKHVIWRKISEGEL
jgi:hypothetical protein